MKKVIIKGAGFVNKGAEAMLRTVQTRLSMRIPGIEMALWQLRPPSWPEARAGGFIPLLLPLERKRFPWTHIHGSAADMLWGIMSARGTGRLSQAAAIFNRPAFLAGACEHFLQKRFPLPDCVLDISGFAYGDAFGLPPFTANRFLVEYCRHRHTPYVCLPQAWGSFRKPGMAAAVQTFLNTPDIFFYSRDERSARYLEEALGSPHGSVPVCPDIAFAFRGGSRRQGMQLLTRMGVSLQRPIVGIAPNMRVYERAAVRDGTSVYLHALVRFITHVIAAHDIDVVLQPNEIDACGTKLDDRYLCSLIAAAVGRPDRCFLTRDSLSAEEVYALVGCFAFMAGSRYHGLVFALSQGVPCLAISWSHKYRELFALFGLERNVYEIADIDSDTLIAAFDREWASRHRLHDALMSTARHVQVTIDGLFDTIADTILMPDKGA